MHTTRTEVMGMFGAGNDQKDPGSKFSFSGEDVFIVYSTKESYSYLDECIRQLPVRSRATNQHCPSASANARKPWP